MGSFASWTLDSPVAGLISTISSERAESTPPKRYTLLPVHTTLADDFPSASAVGKGSTLGSTVAPASTIDATRRRTMRVATVERMGTFHVFPGPDTKGSRENYLRRP